ncbi:MAG: LPXTG cell wall anchor domain-containing protein [Coriobacteriia bacterium]|nr:LPXTG cell wall anchor domain-containing protein [Coriobacteriia bacterium]
MQKLRKRLVAVALALTTMVVAAALWLAMPLVAYADPAVIDVSDFVDGGGDVFSADGVDSWSYNDTTKTLLLNELNGGTYTISGSNSNLCIYAQRASNVTLNNVSLESPSTQPTFSCAHQVQLTLVGENLFTATNAAGFAVNGEGSCVISGSGSLIIPEPAVGGPGLIVYDYFVISGSANVNVTGSPTVFLNNYYPNPIYMGDNASLSMRNTSGTANTNTFVAYDTGSTYRWKLTGGAALQAGYALTDETIEVTLAAGATGTVSREAASTTAYVCERYDSSDVLQASYTSLEDALDEANDGDTIVLLVNLNESSLNSIYIVSDFRLTIDMAGYYLNIPNSEVEIEANGRLSILNGEDLTVDTVTVEGSLVIEAELTTFTTGGLSITGADASAVVSGSLDALVSNCIETEDGATVEVSGDVTSVADCIVATGSSVEIGGNIFAGNTGVIATADSFVAVEGYITAGNVGIAAVGSVVEADGNITASGTAGVLASSGSQVTVNGDVIASGCGIDANASIVEISGDVEAGAFLPAFHSIRATGGSELYVGGNITASDMVFILGSQAEVTGDITLTGVDMGVYVMEEGDLVISGSLSALALTDGWFALYCDNDSTTWVKGDVNSNKNGIWASDGGEVTIDGKLNAPDLYIMLGDFDSYGEAETQLMAADFTTPTTKDGYLTYTDSNNTVWVFDLSDTPDEPGPGGDGPSGPGSPSGPGNPSGPGSPGTTKPTTPATGDIAGLLLLLSALSLLLGAGLLVRRRWLQQAR